MTIEAKAALLREVPGKWEVHSVTLDPPREREVLVRVVATGLCHSDDHFTTGDVPFSHLPLCGGHETAGIVEAVGPGVTTLKEGDHVISSFIPACGRCRWCATGRQNLCDYGALLLEGTQLDGTFRMHLDGEDVAQAAMVGGFAEYVILADASCIKIDPEVPLETAAILGCAVPTGWGSAELAAEVSPGDTVIIYGVGGIGASAVQGARHCGAEHIIAVDPIERKRETAIKFGATQAFGDHEEAADFARSVTDGQGADAAIISVGVIKGEHIANAMSAIRKAGTVVVTAVGDATEMGAPVGLFELTMFQKRIQGALYGMSSPAYAVPRLIELWKGEKLDLASMVSKTYALEEINKGYEDMHAGVNTRGVITFPN